MSSSTADIVSALRCISQVTGQYLTLKDITDSMIGVERSDSVFIDYPCLYLNKLQSIVEIFKPQKTIYCIYGLENDTLDTSRTEDRLICYYNEEKKNYLPLEKDVYRAFSSGNLSDIIKSSTRSAILSQGVYPKSRFAIFHKNFKKLNADGLIVAHTGSVLGFLYHNQPTNKIKKTTSSFIFSQGMDANFGEIF